MLSILGEYIAIGGMPRVVKCWVETKDPARCFALHHAIHIGKTLLSTQKKIKLNMSMLFLIISHSNLVKNLNIAILKETIVNESFLQVLICLLLQE